jgi:hypothetical protein
MRWCAFAVVSVSVEAHFPMRPFARRQRRLIFRSASAAGSTFLACIFEVIPESTLSPFGLALPSPVSFLSPLGARSTHSTRCQVRLRNSAPVDFVSTPLQDLSILRDHSAQLNSRRESLPLRDARFSFAPRGAKNNRLFVCAPDHRSRSATSRQARCPSNLLEPSSSCTRSYLGSIEKLQFDEVSINKYFLWNETFTGNVRCKNCE